MPFCNGSSNLTFATDNPPRWKPESCSDAHDPQADTLVASASASRLLISGSQEPKFVPGRTRAPTCCALVSPYFAMVSQSVPRPTPKQEQTTGPLSVVTPGRRPASNAARADSSNFRCLNKLPSQFLSGR